MKEESIMIYKEPDPMDMQIEKECRLEELHDMEYFVPMTLPERNRLRKWVYNGHSVDSNPWHYTDEHGYELNYLDAYHRRLSDVWGEFYRPFYLVIPNP